MTDAASTRWRYVIKMYWRGWLMQDARSCTADIEQAGIFAAHDLPQLPLWGCTLYNAEHMSYLIECDSLDDAPGYIAQQSDRLIASKMAGEYAHAKTDHCRFCGDRDYEIRECIAELSQTCTAVDVATATEYAQLLADQEAERAAERAAARAAESDDPDIPF